MQYLNYGEYTEMGGVCCDSVAFDRNIDRACIVIDNETHRRIEKMREVPREVKLCCRDLVEYIATNPLTEKTVSSRSQSAGSVSESESYENKTADDRLKEMQNIVYDYLASVTDDYWTPLLYRGAMR
jgi:hypothetical protein